MSTFADCQFRKGGMLEPSAKTRRLDSHEDLIERYLAKLALSDNPRLADLVRAMRGALLSREERVHSILCMEVAGAFGLDPAEVLPAAAAIESVHTLTSIHADLPALNGGEHQRAGRACHEEFGEATAILAGDGFLGTSLALVTNEQKGTPQQLLGVVRELARSAGVGGAIGGQALKTSYAGRTVDHRTLDVMQEHSTGALFEASAIIGAILADATPQEREAIARYARRLGLCFRIVADILLLSPIPDDPTTRPIEAPGAPDGAGRTDATFPALYGLRGARLLADKSLGGAVRALEGIDADTAGLEELAFGVRRGEYSAGATMRIRP